MYFSFYGSPHRSFVVLTHNNPHGWGIAWLDNRGWHLYKEAWPLYSSHRAKELVSKHVCGRIIVSHVRLACSGSVSYGNTHPWLYNGWVFAHNGTIYRRKALLRLIREEYRNFEGDTDSEAFFHLIIQETEDLGDSVKGILSAVGKIVRHIKYFSSLNFVASDGEKLYALRYATRRLDYYTLYYLKRPREGLELYKLSKETQ